MTIQNPSVILGDSQINVANISTTTNTKLTAYKHVILLTGHANITQTTDGTSNEVLSVADNMGAWQWFKISEWCNGQGSVSAGVVTSMWLGKPMLEQPDPMPPIITATLSGTSARVTIVGVCVEVTGGSLIWVPMTAGMTGVSDTGTLPSLSNATLTSGLYFAARTEVTGPLEATHTTTTSWTTGPAISALDTFPATGRTRLASEYRNYTIPTTTITSAPTGGPSQAHVGVLGIFYEGDFSEGHPFLGISCF